MEWVSMLLLAAAPTGAPALPSGLGQVTFHTGVGIMQLIIKTSNVVFGVVGGLIMLAAIYRVLQVIGQFLRGSNPQYQHGFLALGGRVPPALAAVLDILVGFVILGFVLTGAWVGIADSLLGVGGHAANVVSHTISNVGQ
ncbi:MAG: hypothetical protein K6U87_14145 [Firmicutes bacterium]|nr:hypothetical protein [Bacillota bacterium]